MTALGPLVLPNDVVMLPVMQLPPDIRNRIEHQPGDYCVTRPRSRVTTSVVDRGTASLLERFRKPTTIVDAVITFSSDHGLEPRQMLDDAFPVLAGFVRRVATTYTITNRRLNIKRGIVSREIQETRLERVQNVNYRQSVYQRLMQIGDVDFDTAATDDYNFVFVGVAEPAAVVHAVDQATGTHVAGTHGLGEAQPPGISEPPRG